MNRIRLMDGWMDGWMNERERERESALDGSRVRRLSFLHLNASLAILSSTPVPFRSTEAPSPSPRPRPRFYRIIIPTSPSSPLTRPSSFIPQPSPSPIARHGWLLLPHLLRLLLINDQRTPNTEHLIPYNKHRTLNIEHNPEHGTPIRSGVIRRLVESGWWFWVGVDLRSGIWDSGCEGERMGGKGLENWKVKHDHRSPITVRTFKG